MSQHVVYHYTDTARLPWILQSGELQPGRNAIGGFPDPDFLWATTMPTPDGSASSAGAGSLVALREGRTRTVRITLPANQFRLWPEILADFPAWTPDQVRRLEKAARGSNPKHWRCRAEPLARSVWLAVETRGWADRGWQLFDYEAKLISRVGQTLGIEISGRTYLSQAVPQPSGGYGYAVSVEHRRAA